MGKLTRTVRRGSWTAAVLLFLTPFQNCGHFQANVMAQASSAQCRAGYANEALRLAATEGRNLACAAASSFACERRVFAPDQPAATSDARECPGGDEFCVDVVTRRFDTSAARDDHNAAAFLAGGDYNHVEARCYHRWTYRGQAVIERDEADLGAALANVRQACVAAQGDSK